MQTCMTTWLILILCATMHASINLQRHWWNEQGSASQNIAGLFAWGNAVLLPYLFFMDSVTRKEWSTQ